MTKCPQCGSTQFLIAEDTTYSYQCKERGDKIIGVPYSENVDEAKNKRLRCDKCKHEWPVPADKYIVWY